MENIVDCVVAIGAVYNITLTKSDVNNAFYANNGKVVIVKFNSVLNRDSIMRGYFKAKDLKLSDVIGGEISSRVYLNDHMTPAANKLNFICRRMLKEKKIDKFFIMHSDVPKVRLTLPDGSIAVHCYEECLKLVEEITPK